MSSNPAKSLGALDDDDYVAQVLAREACDSSLKYSAQGLEAYMPRRPTGAAPRPNTRFLRNIIKETDSHNAALKRKEEREARERMRQLRNQASTSSHDSSQGNRRRRDYSSKDRHSTETRKERDQRHSSYRRRHRSRSRSTERDHLRSNRRRHKDDDTEYSRHYESSRSRRYWSSSQSRSRSPRNGRKTSSRSYRRHYRTRDESQPRSRSRSVERSDKRRLTDRERGSHRRDHERHSPKKHPSSREDPLIRLPSTNRGQLSESESDPLEDLVGPLPPKEDGSNESAPIRSRGRGAYKPNMSNIDAHFAPDYDPATDVQPEEDDLQSGNRPSRRHVSGLMTGDDDWDYALEAIRDRARWKQKGEERLREAGFGTDFVERWKSNTASKPEADSEGRLENVKWSKKGEGREWDRGKYVDEDGHIDVKASW